MRRSVYFACAALAFWAALLCGCQAAGSLFDVPATEPGQPVKEAPVQTILREVTESSGNPLIAAAGAVAAAVIGAFLGKKGAKTDTANAIAAQDAKEWTAEDIASMAAALRAHGFKMERV